MHSYEAWAGLLKFINDLCLDQVTINHLILCGHVELMLLPTVYLRKTLHYVCPNFKNLIYNKKMDKSDYLVLIFKYCKSDFSCLLKALKLYLENSLTDCYHNGLIVFW